MTRVAEAEHRLLFRDPFAYQAHPHLIAGPQGDWLLVFNRAPRRAFVLHPPQDPEFRNLLTRSADEGRSWSTPTVVPGYDWSGVECAGLTALASGTLLLNQWRFFWYPLPAARARPPEPGLVMPEELARNLALSPDLAAGEALADRPEALLPWARGGGETVLHRSTDGGRSFEAPVLLDAAPYSGGYGMRGGVELPSGEIVLPFSDIPHYARVFVLIGRDGGGFGPPIEAAANPSCLFEEPAPLLLPDGRLLLHLRDNRSRSLWQCESTDGGRSWSRPAPTGIDGYPAHLLRLEDGRLLSTYGYRKPPFGIRVSLSGDQGRSWGPPLSVRADLPNRDLGYPCTLQRRDGTLCTVHYGQDGEGVTAIWATDWRLAD
jgi:hypothetical protein